MVTQDFAQQFRAARRVSTPIVAVQTSDATTTIQTIKQALGVSAMDTPIVVWDAIRGMIAGNDKGIHALGLLLMGENQVVTLSLPDALRLAANAPDDTVLILQNAHLFWSDPLHIQGIWNLRDVFKPLGAMLVLLANHGATLPLEFASDCLMLSEPLPTVDQLAAIVRDAYEWSKFDAPTIDIQRQATDALIGLPYFPAEQAINMCLDPKTGELDIPQLWERKRQAINQTPGLTVWQGSESFEAIGGLSNVKAFLTSIMHGRNIPRCIVFLDEVEKAFAGNATDMSGVKTELTGAMLSWTQDKQIKGAMLLGVPGVAKSQLVKALGNAYNIPVIVFDLAGMQGSLIGQSGANLRNAIACVNAISDGQILMVATSNNIESLPGELRDRFQLGTFFFDVPTASERQAIWAIHRERFAIPADEPNPVDAGWNGRAIEECCYKAYNLRMTLAEAASYTVPITVSNRERIEALRMAANGKYLSASDAGLYHIPQPETQPAPIPAVPVPGRKMRQA
jgi:hypothetical protein